jgi:hypothetical protein
VSCISGIALGQLILPKPEVCHNKKFTKKYCFHPLKKDMGYKLVMKNTFILFALLISSSVFSASADYSCDAREYRIRLNLTQDKSTHIWLQDGNEVIFQAYAKVVEKKGPYTGFYFYPGHSEEALIIFKTEDTINLPTKLYGKINTYVRGFPLRTQLVCRKR